MHPDPHTPKQYAYLVIALGVSLAVVLFCNRSLPLDTLPLHRLPATVPALCTLLLLGFGIPLAPFPRWKSPIDINWERWLGIGCLILTVAKLWLVAGQSVWVIGASPHDDQLFVNLTHSILGGRWLGNYSQFTLMKGPMYSLFMAGVFLSGIPLFPAQHLLYALACWLVIVGLKPLLRQCWLRALLFAALLFNPITYDGNASLRVQRQDLLPILVLAIVAGFIALYARRGDRLRALLPWSLLTGISLGAFWLLREEGVWLVPCIILLGLAAFFSQWREKTHRSAGRLVILILPALLWGGMMGTVSLLNYSYYGIFTTCEFRHPDFKAAYGALTRVKPKNWQPYVVVPREVRMRIYAISPSFSELRPYLEGAIGQAWSDMSRDVTHLSVQDHDIAGGWFMWAMRDAVAEAGHCHTGADAMRFYRQVADEINRACDQGLLDGNPRHDGFSPELRRETINKFVTSLPLSLNLFFRFERLAPYDMASSGTQEQIERFTDITRARHKPRVDELPLPRRQRWLDGIRIKQLDAITRGYQSYIVPLGAVATLALLATLVVSVFQRRLSYFCVLSVASLGSVCAIITAVTLIDASSFPAIDTAYLTGAYGLWILFVFTSCLGLVETLRPLHFVDRKITIRT